MNPSQPPQHQHSGRPLPPRPQRAVFDVMRPGRAQPSSTSKPIITGHKPMVRDASITGLRPIPAQRPLMNSGHKISVQPGATTSVSAPSPVAALRPATQPAAAPVQAPQPFVPAVSQPVLHPTTPIVVQPQSVPQLQPASIGDLSADAGPLTVPTPLPAAPSAHTSIATSDDALFDNLASPAVNPQSYESAAVSRRIGPGNFPLKNILLSVAVLLLLLMLVDILLDADFIGWGVPHTHFF